MEEQLAATSHDNTGCDDDHNLRRRPPLSYAVYRILYGDEFLGMSVESVLPFVDKVFIFWTNRTWSDVSSGVFLSQTISIPSPLDDTQDVIRELVAKHGGDRIVARYDHADKNTNQITHLVNDIILRDFAKPALIIFLEWDHVWRADQLRRALSEFARSSAVAASSRVLECYRTPVMPCAHSFVFTVLDRGISRKRDPGDGAQFSGI
jgi:hypothetical protein